MNITSKNNNFTSFITLVMLSSVLLSCTSKKESQNEKRIIKNDSISVWIKLSKNKSISLEERKSFLLRAYNSNSKLNSEKNKNLLSIAYEALLLRDSSFFRKTNDEAYELSKQLKDTAGIAETYWNYGSFYSDNEIKDSAYYYYHGANKFYDAIDNKYYSAKMQYNMAVIQASIKDYTGSETLTVDAISKFKPLEKNLQLYKSYNHLGVIFYELEEYERSIFYQNEAISYLKKINDNRLYKEGSYNNLSLVYQKLENYNEAINYIEKALVNNKIRTKNPKLYARLIDNLVYNKFLKGNTNTANLSKGFYKSLNLRDSLNDASGVVINKLHLAEYFAKFNDTIKAIDYATSSKELAKSINNNRDHLAALKLLSKIDKENSNKHLNKYISLDDSLKKEERKIRNKFTRIRFETDEYVEETRRLAQQKIWILVVSFISILVLSLLYFLKQQRSRNKELIFETEQQKSNEEIYKLMFKQQTNLEKGRLEERYRISEELHDGVLGKLFGTRMGIGFLNINGDFETIKKHDSYVNELQEIEKEIRLISHELKSETLTTNNSFLSLIESLVESHSKISNYEYKLACDNANLCENFEEKTKINIYRIIQEALMNIAKYSKAKKVKVDFNFSDNLLKLTVNDDGVGFLTNKNKKGIGLINIESRARKLGGKFTLHSIINKGTSLLIEIPL